MNLDFNVALIADYKVDKTYEKELAAIPLSPFTIAGVITVGPELTFGVGVDLGFEASGGVLAGIDVAWNGLNIGVDLISPSSSVFSGFSPSSVTKTLQLSGQIAITGEAYVTIGLDFGLE